MGDVVRTTSEPLLGPIRLAWWRERLEELEQGGAAPAEPRLQAVRDELLGRGIAARDLAALEGGWLRLFDPFPWGVGTSEAIWFRGRRLFALGGQVVGHAGEELESGGGLWALVDAARHCSDPASRTMLIEQARTFAKALQGARFPSPARPLSMLAALAARDSVRGEPFEREGAPARVALMLRHRLSGRIPRHG